MKIVIFCHSFVSCWNHGNAHFLRGVARELVRLGHSVTSYEAVNGWSRKNAIRDGGAGHVREAAALVPGVRVHVYDPHAIDLEQATRHADLVLVHEWNEPPIVARLNALRARGAWFTLLFHDTHHRAVSAPEELTRFDLSAYDGVLAFGDVLREIYAQRGWGARAFTWHEAADVALFKPLAAEKERDLVWIGNWGDDERSAELREFLIEPVRRLRLSARVHGVRYPRTAQDELAAAGIDYAGWLPNHRVPLAFALAGVTVHVPRRPYVEMLPGIPTIRVFEALACGIPLVSAPWNDCEGLFPEGAYLKAGSGSEMEKHLLALLRDHDYAQHVAATGLRAIHARHTCAHRAQELLAIVAALRGSAAPQRVRTERAVA